MAVAIIIVLGGIALCIYWYIWKRSHRQLFEEATGVSAIFSNLLQNDENDDHLNLGGGDKSEAGPIAFPSATGTRPRPKTKKKVLDELRLLEGEMNTLLDKLPVNQTDPTTVTGRSEERENVFRQIKLRIAQERQRQENA